MARRGKVRQATKKQQTGKDRIACPISDKNEMEILKWHLQKKTMA